MNKYIDNGFVVNINDFNVLLSCSEYKENLISLIRNSKNRILFNSLYLENDESGNLIANELINAVVNNPKLKVNIYVDLHRARRSRIGEEAKVCNSQWYKDIFEPINNELVRKYNLLDEPIKVFGVPINVQELFGVYHIKGYLFDDTILYTGASINNTYLGMSTYRIDRYHIITNKELANSFYFLSINAFSSYPSINFVKNDDINIKKMKKDIKVNRKFNKLLSYTKNDQFININESQLKITPLIGNSNNSDLTNATIDLIKLAKKEIIIFTPYFNLPKKIKDILSKKLSNGIKVKLIIGDKTASDFYESDESKINKVNTLPYFYEINLKSFLKKYKKYIDLGILDINLWRDGLNSYHAKGIIVDKNYYLFTGNNLNPRGFMLDAENALLTYDPNNLLLEPINNEINCFLNKCYRVLSYKEIDDFRSYPKKVRKIINKFKIILLDKIAKLLL